MNRRILRFADLDIAAVAQRHASRDRQLTLWYALRASGQGAGCVTRDCLRRVGRSLRLSLRALQRVIVGGRGIFWVEGHNGVLYLKSAPKIARALGVRAFRAAFWRPANDIRGKFSRVRA